MIVCSHCGLSVAHIGERCTHCSGKGIELLTPAKNILSQTQGSRSPKNDRWSKSYTTSPSTTKGATLVTSDRARTPPSVSSGTSTPSHVKPSPLRRKPSEHDVVDVRMDEGELARVYGSVLDPNFVFPECMTCHHVFAQGEKQFVPRDLPPGSVDVLCRSCYAISYSKGTCCGCAKPIVGDRDEGCGGKWVKGRSEGTGWHARCYSCVICSTHLFPLTDESILTPTNQPCCVTCSPQTDPVLETSDLESKPYPIVKNKYPRPSPFNGRDNPGGMSSRTFKSNLPTHTSTEHPETAKSKPKTSGQKVISHMKGLFGEKERIEVPLSAEKLAADILAAPSMRPPPVPGHYRSKSTVTTTQIQSGSTINATRQLLARPLPAGPKSLVVDTHPGLSSTLPKQTLPLRLRSSDPHAFPKQQTQTSVGSSKIHQGPSSARKMPPPWEGGIEATPKALKRQSAPVGGGQVAVWPPMASADRQTPQKIEAGQIGKVASRWLPTDLSNSPKQTTTPRRVSFSSKRSEYPGEGLATPQLSTSPVKLTKPLPTLPSVIKSRPATPAATKTNSEIVDNRRISLTGPGLARSSRVSATAKEIKKAIDEVEASGARLKRWSVPIKSYERVADTSTQMLSSNTQIIESTSTFALPVSATADKLHTLSTSTGGHRASPCLGCGISTDCVAFVDRQKRDNTTQVVILDGKAYHAACLSCSTCGGSLVSSKAALGISMQNGSPVHEQCVMKAPATSVPIVCPTPSRPSKIDMKVPFSMMRNAMSPAQPRLNRLPQAPKHLSRPDTPLPKQLTKSLSYPEFGDRPHPHASVFAVTPSASSKLRQLGGMLDCPGCSKKIGHMERDLIGGPKGTKWHKACLRCGHGEGRGTYVIKTAAQRERENLPGCGKLLDAGAIVDGDGVVWCRRCQIANAAETRDDARIKVATVKTPPAVVSKSAPLSKPTPPSFIKVPKPVPATQADVATSLNLRGLLSPTFLNHDHAIDRSPNTDASTATVDSTYKRIDRELRSKSTPCHVKTRSDTGADKASFIADGNMSEVFSHRARTWSLRTSE